MASQHPFDIAFLDHVALRVQDMEASARWYTRVLGLTRYDVPEWGEFPVFLLAGKTGIALFPPKGDAPQYPAPAIRLDHFAFQVSPSAFDRALEHYRELGLEFEVKDHLHFRSVYTRDPDGHTVELTALQVPPESFYLPGF
ncbi:VOC family protein [Robiginitalea sp. M366]|uniref:VOC family protein n=1 Tax=Robiginitalea aestuariiviva TaxID=3036903 RepID=UPI00240DA61A|nr:VOC family protein [Robiginitalea aestuariiviva]MDG1573462.1 VOC family protein [Robiginitalea aestuariiviva]